MKHSGLREPKTLLAQNTRTRAKAWQTRPQRVRSEIRTQVSCEQMWRFTVSTAGRWRSRPARVTEFTRRAHSYKPGEPFQKDLMGKTSRRSRINIYMVVRNYGWDCHLDGRDGQRFKSTGKMIIRLSHICLAVEYEAFMKTVWFISMSNDRC